MPTVLRADGFRVYFYSRETREPPHVPIDRGGATAKVWLEPVALASSAGFAARDLAVVLDLVRAKRPQLLEAWDGFFTSRGDG
jgi:hypothetical protein